MRYSGLLLQATLLCALCVMIGESDPKQSYANPANYLNPKTPFDFSAVGDGLNDDTKAMQRLFEVGGRIPELLPGRFFKITSTLHPSANVSISGSGRKSVIKLALPESSPASPVIEVKSDAPNVSLSDFTVDAGFDSTSRNPSLIRPVIYNSSIIAGSAIILGGDNATVRNVNVSNSWDNGIAIIALDSNKQPALVDVGGVRCMQNGWGSQGGACVDNASGIASTIHDCIDLMSQTGFILDIGAGAHGNMSNLISRGARKLGFYIGGSDTNLSNLYTEFSDGMGFWLDAAQQNKVDDFGHFTSFSRVNAVNLIAYRPRLEGFLIKGGELSITNARVVGAYTDSHESYKGHFAFHVDTNTDLYHITCVSCTNNEVNNVEFGWGQTKRNGVKVETKLIDSTGLTGKEGSVMPGVE